MSENRYSCPPDHKHAETGTCWQHGCRCGPCSRRENARVREAYRFDRAARGLNRRVRALGAARRLQALAYMGWTIEQISRLSGLERNHVGQIRRGARTGILLTTHQKIDRVFQQLAYKRATGRSGEWTRNYAKKQGYAPAAAWGDIDNPRERPKGVEVEAA